MNSTEVSPRRRRSNSAERAQWAERFAQSGLSVNEFAMQESLKLSTLQRWIYEHRAKSRALEEPHPPQPAKVAFHELALPRTSTRWAVEVLRADGCLIRLAHDAPAPWLQLLLAPC